MPFGISSAPGLFQKFMEEVIVDIPHCAVYLDDIIVSGQNDDEHITNVNMVFQRLRHHGLQCKLDKCSFAQKQIEYVGHIIDDKGIQPSEKRVDAIKNMPRPQNVTEVEAFIGKVNYYNKFIDSFSTIAAPLNRLRRKSSVFQWGKEEESAFQSLKNSIVEATRLVHYDDNLPIILAVDASKLGVGAVLSHRFKNGEEKPIAHASKTLNSSQINYSQVEKEALAIIYGVTKFHQYLYGRKFELFTDHQALTTLFNPAKRLPVMALHRIQRWAIVLQAYNYTIRYKKSFQNANADALSRLPCGEDPEFDKGENSVFSIDVNYEAAVNSFPITDHVIKQMTEEDETLKLVLKYVLDGWPQHAIPKSLLPYFNRNLCLSVQNGVLLLHTDYTRVIIPKQLQGRVLTMLHDGHWGKSRMKEMARRYVWFPTIEKEIEKIYDNCSICQSTASLPKREFSKWPEATQPWERIHLDFAGPFYNRMWLIIVDSYSKFPYVIELSAATTTTTVAALQKIISVEGLPCTIVTDNGTQFTSHEFQQFCKRNSIQHLTTAPFHPASNGLAERFVRTFKEAFVKIMKTEHQTERALYKYLTTFRTTPNPVSGKSPAELLHGRQPRTILAAMFPTSAQRQKSESKFVSGARVWARSYAGPSRWVEGKIQQIL
ncbi:PREDICTED: uncharacterized protein K02A2.6-like, partial [Rhagoletis zephyria]